MKHKKMRILLPVLAVLIAVPLGLMAYLYTGAWGYAEMKNGAPEGMELYGNVLTKKAFVGESLWDGTDGETIEIPDSVNGCRVTALGGFFGRGVPVAFCLTVPEEWNTKTIFGDRSMVEKAAEDAPDAELIDLTVTLKLGKNIDTLNAVTCYGWGGCDETMHEQVWRLRWYVECDGENETFRAENGRLYYRANGQCVEEFYYWDE